MDKRFNHRRRISDIYETDNVSIANCKLHNGWELMKAIISNRIAALPLLVSSRLRRPHDGKSFYILVRYEEDEKCERTNIAASPLEQTLKAPT